MDLSYITMIKGKAVVEMLGDDKVDEARLLINGGARLIKTPSAPVLFAVGSTDDFIEDSLELVWGPGRLIGDTYEQTQQGGD